MSVDRPRQQAIGRAPIWFLEFLVGFILLTLGLGLTLFDTWS